MPGSRLSSASPADALAALREGIIDPGVAFESRAWPELQLVGMTFGAPGACVVPPAAFPAVATSTGCSSYLGEESLATAVAARLLERHAAALAGHAGAPGGLARAAFARVRGFVEDHLGDHISLQDLAGVAGVSRFHFARQFRLRTGQSPMEFVRRSRVERAKAMLRAGTATAGEVAASLGFADQSHFTRTFRRLVGTSPRVYAALHRGSAPGGGAEAGGPEPSGAHPPSFR